MNSSKGTRFHTEECFFDIVLQIVKDMRPESLEPWIFLFRPNQTFSDSCSARCYTSSILGFLYRLFGAGEERRETLR